MSLQPAEQSFADTLSSLEAAGVLLRIPDHEQGRLERVTWVRSAISEFRPDFVLAHSVIPAAYARLAAASLGERNVIAVLHSATNDDYADEPFRTSEWLLRWLSKGVVAVSPSQARNYEARYGKPSPRVIANGIDTEIFREAEADRNTLRTQFGLSNSEKLILQVGRISPVKGQLLTAEAVKPILARDPSVRLWFAGLVEDSGYHQRLMAELSGRGSHARWLGSRSDVPSLIAAADVFVMPSSQEAHSVGILEALSTHVPIVASDIVAFGFLEGFASVSRAPRDVLQLRRAIEGALASPRSPRAVDQFSITRTSRDYLDYLSSLGTRKK